LQFEDCSFYKCGFNPEFFVRAEPSLPIEAGDQLNASLSTPRIFDLQLPELSQKLKRASFAFCHEMHFFLRQFMRA